MDYYKAINERALASYQGPELNTKENLDVSWVPHWIATAEQFRDEFAAQNLPATAEHVQKIVDDAKRYVK